MSDESTIAASTLLSSLLGATSTTPLLSTPILPEGNAELEIGDSSGTFGQLLHESIDAGSGISSNSAVFGQLSRVNIGANESADGAFANSQPDNQQLSASFFDTELGGTRNEFKPHLPALALNIPAAALNQTGNEATVTGNSLPLDQATVDLSARPDIALSNIALSNIEGAWGETKLSGSAEQSQIESTEHITTSLAEQNAQDLATSSENLEPLVPLTQPVTSTAAATVNAIPSDQNSIRTREFGSTNSTFNANGLEPEIDTTLEGDAGLDQQGADDSTSPEEFFEARNQQRSTAEFALEPPRKNEFQYATGATSAGEFSSTALNALNPTAVTNPSVSATALTLSPDRQLASQQIAQHIASFARQGDDFVEINLSPPHLGKITARIMMQNDQASVVLTAPSADIRELMESSLPKLGSLLEEAGITLADANVSSQNQSNNSDDSADENRAGANGSDDGNPVSQETAPAPAQQRLKGLLDAYA